MKIVIKAKKIADVAPQSRLDVKSILKKQMDLLSQESEKCAKLGRYEYLTQLSHAITELSCALCKLS